MITVMKTSPFSGLVNTMEIDCTQVQLDRLADPYNCELIQDIFPKLDVDTREFLKTGIAPGEWI